MCRPRPWRISGSFALCTASRGSVSSLPNAPLDRRTLGAYTAVMSSTKGRMAATTERKRRPLHTHRLASLYVEPKLAETLDALSEKQGRSQAELRREALREFLAKRA